MLLDEVPEPPQHPSLVEPWTGATATAHMPPSETTLRLLPSPASLRVLSLPQAPSMKPPQWFQLSGSICQNPRGSPPASQRSISAHGEGSRTAPSRVALVKLLFL